MGAPGLRPVPVADETEPSHVYEDAPVHPAQPAAPPSREEIRQRIESGLRSGNLDSTAILADIYASQYAFELNLRSLINFLDGFAMSGIGKRLFKGKRKQADDIAAELAAALEETEK